MSVVVLGSLNADLVFRVQRLPAPGETVPGTTGPALPGGKGLNQAVAAARDGAAVRFAGCVGRDAHGAMLRAALAAEGVDVAAVAEGEAPSGQAAIWVDAEGRNQIVVAAGANGEARAAALGALHAADTLLLQMEVPAGEVAAAIARGRAAGARVVLNLAPALPLPRAALAALDLLVVNEPEAAWLAAQLGCGASAAALHAALGCGVAVTLGARGAAAATPAGAWAVAACQVAVVDTVGAGDAWCGVLAAALDRGQPLEPAMQRAAAAAALACTRLGAAPAMPRAAETEALLSAAR